MANLQNQNCPLCKQVATFSLDNFDQDKAFNCPICTQYIISTLAEEKLKTESVDYREGLSKMAKDSPEGKFLLIKLKGGEINPIYIGRLEAYRQ